ncbi:NmrA-like family protein [Lasiosphaeris hirsuta]|uniref:NmrA-like family protein n=1 Tax=Lasiosphaeris hirsuta TaxID=260670 RepID=A0AA40E6K9_9PEZI|nr:NmrA-like family protein [Lasiosphaeris hirsuta]
MADRKIMTVFGATGALGGSVADIFLTDPTLKSEWTVRAVTRDITKDSAKKLQAAGAEVVTADLNDKSTLVTAMTSASAVFAMTNYWEYMDAAIEIQQGKNIVDAAQAAGVAHLIFTSLPNVTELSKGALPNVYHFDSKAAVEAYARATGIPATFFLPAFFMSNFTPGKGMLRQAVADGVWELAMPVPAAAPLPFFDTGDTGKFVKAAVLHRDELLGKRLLGATEYITFGAVVDGFKKVFPEAGKNARYVQQTHDEYKGQLTKVGMPEVIAQELLENFLLFDQVGYYGGESLSETHSFVEDKLTTWGEFIKNSPKFAGLQ